MKITNLVENKDGSCDVELEMTKDEHQMLIQYAVTNLLKEYIERMKNENNICPPISE